jgi:hypothetical protein
MSRRNTGKFVTGGRAGVYHVEQEHPDVPVLRIRCGRSR